MEEELAQVAHRVREWRDEAGYTLQQLAALSGVAASTIQKVETRQMVPTIAVLLKIAHGLGRRPSEFVQQDSTELGVMHLETGDHRSFQTDGYTAISLHGEFANSYLETWRVECLPGSAMGLPPVRFEGEQLFICEEGDLTIQISEERFVLRAGDSLHFKAELPHQWSNESDAPATFIVIGTLIANMRRAAVDDDAAD